jgi:hypothetical protein
MKGAGGNQVGASYREAMDDPDAMRKAGLGVIFGNPADWIAALKPYQKLFEGRDAHLAFRLSYPGVTLDAAVAAVRLIGREVIPAFRTVTPA